VDVPGHERFVKNMLAGAGGIDLALFAIDAVESVKPQTREHFEICRLLGVSRGLIALTKTDLADADRLALTRMEVEELAAGSFLEGVPVVPVSVVTGAGLDDLRRELARVAASVPERNPEGWFRLPIDRVFTVKGAGAVVTGTLISGTVAREQEVEVYPGGRRLRVRGLEVHGSMTERAAAGQRTALNLADIEVRELSRGDVLSEPGRFDAVRQIDCRLELLPSAKPLKHRAPVHFHSGTAGIEAEVRLLGAAGDSPAVKLQPGASAWVRILLRDPCLLLPGDRFIIRMFSPVTTIGGGVVVYLSGADLSGADHRFSWSASSARGSGRAGRGPGAAARLEMLASPDPAARLALLVREAPFGVGIPEVAARTGMLEWEITAAASRAPVVVLAQPRPWYVDRAWFQSAQERLTAAVGAFHRANPLAPGIAKEDLRGRELPGAPPFLLDALLVGPASLPVIAGNPVGQASRPASLPVIVGNLVRSPGHQVALQDDERRACDAIERAFEQAGLATPPLSDALAKSGVEPARARALLAILLRDKTLIRIAEDLVFHAAAIRKLRALLAARKPARFRVGDFKEWTGISRKYAIPLLEYLDRERITRREGDERVIL